MDKGARLEYWIYSDKKGAEPVNEGSNNQGPSLPTAEMTNDVRALDKVYIFIIWEDQF